MGATKKTRGLGSALSMEDGLQVRKRFDALIKAMAHGKPPASGKRARN
jgi:hypothetical protein